MTHGKICYLEIPANLAEDSANFYRDIFGWKIRRHAFAAFTDPAGNELGLYEEPAR